MTDGPGNLVASLVQASYDQYASTSRQLIDSFRHDAATYRAERDLIQEAVEDLLNGPYAPSGTAIFRALQPPEKAIKARAAQYLAE